MSFKLEIRKPKSVCSNCGYVGHPVKETKGNLLIEVILWLLFIFPGILYSIWRMSGRKLICPTCKQQTMVPVNTPVGQQLMEKYGKANS